MGFLLTLGVWAVMWAIDYYLRKSAADDVKPQEQEKMPRVTESEPVPFVFGTWLIENPNVLWDRSGNYEVGDADDNGFYEYFISVKFALCLSNIPVSDTTNAAQSTICAFGLIANEIRPTQGVGWQLRAPSAVPGVTAYDVGFTYEPWPAPFGTLEYNAGLWDTDHGELAIHAFTDAGLDPNRIEPNQGVVTVMLTGHPNDSHVWANFRIGRHPMPPRFAFEICNPCIMPGFAFGLQLFDKDVNPISVLWTVLTAGWGRLALDPSIIDTDSFNAAAQVCWDERNCMSGMVTSKEAAISLVQRILDQIEATFYFDPETLLLTVRMIREDYDPNALFHVTQDMVTKAPEWTSTTYADTLNLVRVTFTNRDKGYKEDEVLAHDQANFDMTGVVRDQTFSFPWITNSQLASRVATRILRANAIPLDKVQFGATRALVFWTPGLAFKYTHTNNETFIMRVLRVEPGSTTNGEVTVYAVVDRWSVSYTLVEPPVVEETEVPIQPQALMDEDIVESPRWILERRAILEGSGDPDGARLMYLAAPSDEATSYRGFIDTTGDGDTMVRDTVIAKFCGSARLKTAYSRTLDPQDTTTGLEITSIQNWTFAAATELEVRTRGLNLISVGEGPTAEIMAFLSSSDDGDDKILEQVFRGMLDTTPRDHEVGEPVFELDLSNVPHIETVLARLGRTGFQVDDAMVARIVPRVGTREPFYGDVPLHDITARERPVLPYPVADMNLAAVTAWANFYVGTSKGGLTVEEDGVNLTWQRRDRLSPTITLGTDDDEPSPESDVTYSIIVQKDGDSEHIVYDGQDGVAIYAVPTGQAGHGALTVSIRTVRTETAGGETLTYESWQDAYVDAEYMPWRNLLVNPGFLVNGSASFSRWTTVQGTPVIVASGPYGVLEYVIGTLNDDPTEWYQHIRVDGYRPKRMRATLTFKAKNVAAFDTNDTILADLTSHDDSGTQLDIATQTTTAPSDSWTKYEVTITNLDADTKGLRARFVQTAVGEPGSEVPSAAIADPIIRLGQFTDNVLLQPELGPSTGTWTLGAGSFSPSVGGIPAEGTSYIVGGANAVNTLYQEPALTDGYHYGYAVGMVAVKHTGGLAPGDVTVNITIEARDAGGAVLASQTRNPVTIQEAFWVRVRVYCALPLGTDHVRFTLSSTRNSGSANNVAFDDADLRYHKYLDPQFEKTFDFSQPNEQIIPRSPYTWSPDYALSSPNYGMFPGTPFGALGSEPAMTVEPDVRLAKVFTPDEYRAYEFREDLPAVVRVRSNFDYANFASSESFVAVVFFTPHTNLTEYGLCGRLGSTGWSLDVNGGQTRARLVGSLSTKSVNDGYGIARGGLVAVGLIYDQAGALLTVVHPRTSASVSTVGMGEISCDEEVTFCIGDATATSPVTMSGTISAVYLWRGSTTTVSAVQELLVWGSDHWSGGASLPEHPVGASPVSCVVGENDDGLVLGEFASGTVGVWAKVGDLIGLPTSPNRSQLVAPNPNTTTDWDTTDPSVIVTLNAAIAPNGRWEAVRIDGDDIRGRQVAAALNDTDPVHVSFMARRLTVSGNGRIRILEAGGDPCSDYIPFAMTTSWKRFDLFDIALYPGFVPARVAWFPSDNGDATMELAGPVWIDQSTTHSAPPICIPTVNSGDSMSHVDVEALDLDPQHNYEGEIAAEVVTLNPAVEPGIIAILQSNGNDTHKLYLEGGQTKFSHRDGSGTEVISEVTESTDWTTKQTLRGRWNRLGLLDAANAFAGVVTNSGQDFDRASTWTADDGGYDTIHIANEDTVNQFNGLIVRLTVRARERILPE